MKYPSDSDTAEYLDKAAAANWARTNGIIRRPQPPRNLQSQSGARKVLVTWDAPQLFDDIVGWKIYTGVESSLLDTIYDPNVRQYSVPAQAGPSPPTVSIFVSSISKRSESVKMQTISRATTEAGAPADPKPPSGSAATGETGGTFGIDGSANSGGGNST